MEKENHPAPGPVQEEWWSDAFRVSMIRKLEAAIKESRWCPTVINANELEMKLSKKANSQQEYLNVVAKLILHIQKIKPPAEAEVNRQQQQQ